MNTTNQSYQHALKLLTIKAYSQHKLITKLKEKGFDADDIEHTIEKLKELNYINEEEFIRSRTRALLRKNFGDDYILQKCRSENLSITHNIIQEERDFLKITPEIQIQNLLDKKLGVKSFNELEFSEKVKINRFLVSKGHNFSGQNTSDY